MRHIDVSKKRPSHWPWVIGVIVLGLALWGATVLLAPPADDDGPELPVTAADTLPPSSIPIAQGGAMATPEPPSLSELMPLDEEDVGETVQVEGEVVATGNDAFWIMADSRVIRVDSRQRARKGDTLTVRGVLQPVEDDENTDRVVTQVLSREPGSAGWTIINTLKLVEGDPDEEESDEASDEEGDGEGDTAPRDST